MENLVLLHGALGAASTLTPLAQALQGQFTVYTLDFSGHGGRAVPQELFSMELFVQDVLRFLEENHIQSTHIFGYSMGGYVALNLALHHPQRVKSIYTLATKFDWSAAAAAKETKLLNPEKTVEKVPAFAAALARCHHPQDWKQVMRKTAEMLLHLGNQPTLTPGNLSQLQLPVQVAVGDQDTMVSVEETLWAYRLLPDARLQVLPGTRHPLEHVAVSRLTEEIRQFIQQVSV